jgi:hypothetical protein
METATAAAASDVDGDKDAGNKKETAAAINTAVLRKVSAHTCCEWLAGERKEATTGNNNKTHKVDGVSKKTETVWPDSSMLDRLVK